MLDAGTATRLAQFSDKEQVVSNALLLLAGVCAKDLHTAQALCSADVAGSLLLKKSRVEPHREVLARLYASCTCHEGVQLVGESTLRAVAELFLVTYGRPTMDPKVREVCLLGLGNLCCDSRAARELVFAHKALDRLLGVAAADRSENWLGLLANVSVDFQNEAMAQAVHKSAPDCAHAAFVVANCAAAKVFKPKKELVDRMLQATDQAVQQSAIDIVAAASPAHMGPTPGLCWLTRHGDAHVRRKAREQVRRFVSADLLALFERGCVPALWQLSLGLGVASRATLQYEDEDQDKDQDHDQDQDQENEKGKEEQQEEKDGEGAGEGAGAGAGEAGVADFAAGVLQSLRDALTPTVHQLLLRTLRMEGNEVLRGHVASALAHLAPQVLTEEEETLESVVEMLEEPQGRLPALAFVQSVHAIATLRGRGSKKVPSTSMSAGEDGKAVAGGGQSAKEDRKSAAAVLDALRTSKGDDAQREALGALLDNFDGVYNRNSKRDVHAALRRICAATLR